MKDLEDLPDDCAICLVGHGTQNQKGVTEFFALFSMLKDRAPERVIECGFLDLAKPTFEEAIAKCNQEGIKNIIVLPGLLISANHAKKEIPDKVISMAHKYPDLNIKYGRPLGVHPKILKVCSERIEAAETHSISSVARIDTLLMTVAHGSTDPDVNSTTAKVSQMLRETMKFGRSEISFIGSNQPLLSESLELNIKKGFKRIIVFPYFLFNGVLTKRIASTVYDIAKKHPEVELLKAQHLNSHEWIVDVFMERACEASLGL